MNENDIMERLREMSRPERFALLGHLADIHEQLQKLDEPSRKLAVEILHDGLLDRMTMASLVSTD